MGRKKNNLLEVLIDKIVLAVSGVVCLWILLTCVIGNPNSIEYNGRKLGTGNIDKYVNDETIRLEERLRKEPKQGEEYKPQKPYYLSLVKTAVRDVDTAEFLPVPAYVDGAASAENRVYRVPLMPDVNSVSVAAVRMAAFVPTEELSPQQTYAQADTRMEDLDLVTVTSNIDVSGLYEEFQSNFAGKNIQADWRNEEYAKPVFAKVELQRRRITKNGQYSQWQEVPRTRICHLSKALELPEKLDEYELEIALHQFSKNELRGEVLQPDVYDNAVPSEPWLPPPFYNEREKRLEKEEQQKRKEELSTQRSDKLRDRSMKTRTARQQTKRRTAGRQLPDAGGGMGMPGMGMGMPGMGMGGAAPARPARPQRRRAKRIQPKNAERATARSIRRNRRDTAEEKQMSEAEKFDAVRLIDDIKPEQMKNLVFWAHDDTIETGAKYQYRIRVGVFNPIAGTSWFSEDQKNLQNKMVLWSNFSEPSAIVEIPKRLYFFPISIHESTEGRSYVVDKTVEVKVARFSLGNWVSKTFNVKRGEEIGKVISALGSRLDDAGIDIDTIDFSTGRIMVDAKRVTEWVGAGFLRPREHYELIYSLDGNLLEAVPVKERYWPDAMVGISKKLRMPKLMSRWSF